jgi:hypothetical protein
MQKEIGLPEVVDEGRLINILYSVGSNHSQDRFQRSNGSITIQLLKTGHVIF